MEKKLFDEDLIKEIKANLEALDACTGHNFSPIDRRTKAPLEKPIPLCRWKCSACGGITDYSSVKYYRQGLAHASTKT